MRIKILVILLILITGKLVLAQKRVYKSNPKNLYSLIDSARLYEKLNPAKSFDYIEEALKQSLESQDKLGEALSYQVLGNINSNLNQPDLAISYYNKAAAIFNSIPNQNQLYQTYSNLAGAYYQNNDYANTPETFGVEIFCHQSGPANYRRAKYSDLRCSGKTPKSQGTWVHA